MAEDIGFSKESIEALNKTIEKELNKAQESLEESSRVISEIDNTPIDSIKIDPQEELTLQKELDLLRQDMGESTEVEKTSTEIDKELEALEQELENEKTNAIPNRVGDIDAILLEHIGMAEKAVEKSSNQSEKEILGQFKNDAEKLSSAIGNGLKKQVTGLEAEERKKNNYKFMSSIHTGLSKLYGGLKSGVSKTIDTIKDLGRQAINAISSLFNKTPKEQNASFSKVIDQTAKAVNTEEAKKQAQDRLVKLREDYEKKQAIVKKFFETEKEYKQKLETNKEQLKGIRKKQLARSLAKGVKIASQKNTQDRNGKKSASQPLRNQRPNRDRGLGR